MVICLAIGPLTVIALPPWQLRWRVLYAAHVAVVCFPLALVVAGVYPR